MSSLADILNTGRSALRVQQLAMQVIGQNMANVGTDGYSRRRIEFTAASPSGTSDQWNTGSGVDVQYLGRVRDRLIDDQIHRAGSSLGYWGQRDDAMGRVEAIFNELGDDGICDQLEQFWGAWNDLANNPEGSAARISLSERTQALTASVRSAYSALETRQAEADLLIQQGLDEVNSLTAQIAGLNVQIVQLETGTADASDLRDARDKALDRLSQLININTRESADGSVGIYTDGQMLVQLDQSVDLTKTNTTIDGRTVSRVGAGIGGRPLHFEGGEIKAFMELRDTDIPATMADLDEFATTLSARVNALHRTGYGLNGTSGQDFFASDVTGAASFRLNAAILDDPDGIAAAGAPDAPGDNSLALAIAGVQREKLLNGGRSTIDDFFRDAVLQVGARKAYSASQFAIEAAAMDHLQSRRQEVSGVSLDEEMTRLVQVQQAYDAAARIINTVDQMMQTVLSLGASA